MFDEILWCGRKWSCYIRGEYFMLRYESKTSVIIEKWTKGELTYREIYPPIKEVGCSTATFMGAVMFHEKV